MTSIENLMSAADPLRNSPEPLPDAETELQKIVSGGQLFSDRVPAGLADLDKQRKLRRNRLIGGASIAAVAAVILVAVFTNLGQPRAIPIPMPANTGIISPQPSASPSSPTPASSTPTSSTPVTAVAPPPANTPPPAVPACSINNIVPLESRTGNAFPRFVQSNPGDFAVLGCAGNWLAFEITETGSKRLSEQGADGGNAWLYYAYLQDGKYLFSDENLTFRWEFTGNPESTTAERIADMESQLVKIGVPVGLREALIGNPPQ